jgi:hypothetical protein
MPRSASVLAVFLLAAPASATDIVVRDRGAFNTAMTAVKPGDRVLLAPGDYNGNFFFTNVHGAPRRPVVIAAADRSRPPRFIGPSIGLQLSGCSYVELYDLDIAGTDSNGLTIDDANDPAKPAHHIVIRNVRVKDTRKNGNIDGIKLSGVDDFLIADCTVEGWGNGGSGIDMVGCHRGVITRSTFRQGGANGLQMKGGSADVTVRKCLFENAGERALQIGGSSDDTVFRPPLKDMPEKGKYEAKEVRVEGNTFVGGEAAVAFVNADGATVRFNTIVRPERYALRILQERGEPEFVPCRKGVIEDNVIVFRSDRWSEGGVNVGAGTDPGSFAFSRNLWFCEDRPDRSTPNLLSKEKDGVYGKDPLFFDPVKGDYSVKPGSPASKRGAHALPGGGK